MAERSNNRSRSLLDRRLRVSWKSKRRDTTPSPQEDLPQEEQAQPDSPQGDPEQQAQTPRGEET